MAKMRIALINPKNKAEKVIDIPMPEGIKWPDETQHVIDFISKGEVYMVAGLQIEAINDD